MLAQFCGMLDGPNNDIAFLRIWVLFHPLESTWLSFLKVSSSLISRWLFNTGLDFYTECLYQWGQAEAIRNSIIEDTAIWNVSTQPYRTASEKNSVCSLIGQKKRMYHQHEHVYLQKAVRQVSNITLYESLSSDPTEDIIKNYIT